VTTRTTGSAANKPRATAKKPRSAASADGGTWPEATARLLADPTFGPLIRQVGPVKLRPSRGDPFQSLAGAIVFQQLAGKAALTIHGRFVEALKGDVRPETVLAASDAKLRGAGLSGNKMAALRDLAAQAHSGAVPLHDLHTLDDEAVVERLTRVRGVGRWTAEMFLIFDLHRPDVWPVGDLGVRVGLGKVLAWDSQPTPRETELVGVGYRPWRSATAWYCWRAVEVYKGGRAT
jgi:DNA-3-methyladenine glycosylase II